MAPSRRKRAKSAAASRQWNVGELVLAKVKGYPAWPATVSKPEKWGYSSNQKKVLVCFFGTQEIALCNPADLEEFTEEKKLKLLGKRYGKGSDFSRALNEIIDCFDELKKQDQVSGDELFGENDITVENMSGDSFTKYVKDDGGTTSVEQLADGSTNCLESVTETDEAAPATDALHDEVMQLEEEHANFPVTERHVNPTRGKADTSKLGSREARVSSRSLRSSSRVGTLSSDKGSTLDMICKSVGGMPFHEDSEGITELSRLDFQPNAGAIENKRKANQPNYMQDTSLVEARADLVVSEDELPKTDRVTHNETVTLNRCTQQDGDEHLSLAKRARIRMGSHAENEEGSSICEDEKAIQVNDSPNVISDVASKFMLANRESIERDLSKTSPAKQEVETLVHKQDEVPKAAEGIMSSGALNCNVDAPVDETSDTNTDPGDTSISPVSPIRNPQSLASMKDFIACESALPLSKRINRALEAMSANASEADVQPSSCSPAVKAHDDVYLSSCSVEGSEMPVRKAAAIKLGSEPVEGDSIIDSQTTATECCVKLNLEAFEHDGKTACITNCLNPEISEGSSEHMENVDNTCEILSPLCNLPAESDENQHLKTEFPDARENLAHLGCNTTCSISVDGSCAIEHIKESAEGVDPHVSHMNSDSILVQETPADSLNAGNCAFKDSSDSAIGKKNKMKLLSLSENDLESQRSEIVKAPRPASPDVNVVPTETPMKLSTSSDCGYSRPNSISDDIVADRTVLINQSSSSFIVGQESPPISLLSSSNMESLSSFEGLVRSLTRSKETIGRATRSAIDCAKFGFASKVVEILVHSLERESSLPKKVDLFFLVDSITQCSSCLKGDCGVYPSIIQPLLPRMLLAAAPRGLSYYENQRQCLKVLKVWLERKIIPEPIIRHHIQELDAFCNLYHSGGSQRLFRNERAFDDPVREMEGMLVDEYGSNSSIQFPGFCMPPMLSDADGGSDSDGDDFEAVTPEHNGANLDGGETTPKVEKRSHFLEDVDGELEMEDVAPCSESKITSTSNIAGSDRNHHISFHSSDDHCGSRQLEVAPPPPPPPPHPSHHTPPSFSSHANHYKRNHRESWEGQSDLPRINSRIPDAVKCYNHEDQYSEWEPRQWPDSRRVCSSNDKGFHPPYSHPTPSHQLSYTQEQRSQSRMDAPPYCHSNRFRSRHSGNGSFHRDFDRSRYAPPQGSTEEYWGPPSPSTSGQCYDNGSRMGHAPMPPNYPPNKTTLPGNRRRVPPWLMNRMQFNPCRPPLGGPVPVGNRGPNNWKSR